MIFYATPFPQLFDYVLLFLMINHGNSYKAVSIINIGLQCRRACCVIIVEISTRTTLSTSLLKELSVMLAIAFSRCESKQGDEVFVALLTTLAKLDALQVGSKLLHTLFSDISCDRTRVDVDISTSRFILMMEKWKDYSDVVP